MEDSGSHAAMQSNTACWLFGRTPEAVRPVVGHMPDHIPRCTAWCGVGAPRRGAHQPPPAHEVARFYLAPIPADDSATLNTPSAASNAPVCDGCIAAGLVGIANAMRRCCKAALTATQWI